MAQVGWCSTGIADVAKGTGSLVKANQARTHTHTHTRTADSETKQFLFEPRCWNSLACVPALFRFLSCPDPYPLHTSFPLILQPRFLSPLAPAIELYIYIYIYARISPVSGEKKGVFLEITTGEYLEEEHPSRFRSGGERGGSRCRGRILSREWEEDGWKVRAKMRKKARKRKEGGRRGKEKSSVEVEKPANRQERETIAISASVHDVQRRRETRERETAAITREKAARENA